MKLAISNIAWTAPEEEAAAHLLAELGVGRVEVACTKQWPDLSSVSHAQADGYREWWARQGIEIVAMQSLLFGKPELTIFESQEKRDDSIKYLTAVMELAARLGAKALVYGSPKNRQKGDMSDVEAEKIACEYFLRLGEVAYENGVTMCLEPNPRDYACDFVYNTAQGAGLVRLVDHPGFRLHLDVAAITMEKDPLPQSIVNSADILAHFHVSEPFLGPVGSPDSVAGGAAISAALTEAKYDNIISIEMKATQEGNVERARRAIEFVQKHYAS